MDQSAPGNSNKTHQLPLGTMLQGQYRIGPVLGQGGFGITYRGWDVRLSVSVAIKEYYPSGLVTRDCTKSLQAACTAGEEQFRKGRERFLREAMTLARLRHIPEIVCVHNFFEENGTAYIVMEYVEGTDLRGYIESRGGRLTAGETFAIVGPVMEALSKVHDGGLIHRDISPDNIMLPKKGGIKLLDFGTAKDVDPQSGTPRSTEAILKHGFAPIEQYQRQGAQGPWTDEYALCATAYYCLTGRVPPDAPERLTDGIQVPWYQIPDLTPKQITALSKGMSVLAKDRYPSLRELFHDLYEAPDPESPSPVWPWILAGVLAGLLLVISCIIGYLYSFAKQEDVLQGPTASKGAETAIGSLEPDTHPCDHQWVIVSCEEPQICSLCGVEGKTLGHSFSFPTYSQPSRCARCGLMTGTPLGLPMAANFIQTIGLRPGGMVLAVGDDIEEELDEDPATRWSDVSQWSGITALAMGYSHAVGLRSDGTVVAAGRNNAGQCDVNNWTDICYIAAGDYHTVGICSNGTVVAVGNNAFGQCNVSDWRDIVSVSACGEMTVGLRSDGTVVAVGNNVYGQCEVSDWENIVAVAAGKFHVVGVRADGTVVAVGETRLDRCNVSEWTDIVGISANVYHTVGLRSDGTVVACGDNYVGRCDVFTWSGITAVATGNRISLGLRSDGTLLAVGYNEEGQCEIWGWGTIGISPN